jgi:uncharacterized protein YkwD
MARPLIRVLLVALAAVSPDAALRPSSCQMASSSLPDVLASKVATLRAAHGSDPLAWSFRAADFALSRARALAAASAGLSHDEASAAYGENLAMISALDASVGTSLSAAERALSLWYGESAAYDYASPGYSAQTGHFTQLVWRATRAFGAGVAVSPDGRWYYVAFEFDPPGNHVSPGAFVANVAAPKTGAS